MESKTSGELPRWASAQLFEGLLPDQISLISEISTTTSLAAGEHVFRLGDRARAIYIVEEGAVTLTLPVTLRGEERQVAIESEHPGDLLGWSALVPPYRRTLGALAAAPCVLARFAREDLEPIFGEHPQIHLAICTRLCELIGRRLTLMEAVMLRDLEKWGSRID